MQHRGTIEVSNRCDEFDNSARVGHPQHGLYVGERDFIARVSNSLIQQAQSVAHPPGGGSGDQLSRAAFEFDLFLLRHEVQTRYNLPRCDALKVETLAA